MKVIPKEDLITIINLIESDTVSQRAVDYIFDTYGDDWFMEYGCDYELCTVNEERKAFIERVRRQYDS